MIFLPFWCMLSPRINFSFAAGLRQVKQRRAKAAVIDFSGGNCDELSGTFEISGIGAVGKARAGRSYRAAETPFVRRPRFCKSGPSPHIAPGICRGGFRKGKNSRGSCAYCARNAREEGQQTQYSYYASGCENICRSEARRRKSIAIGEISSAR